MVHHEDTLAPSNGIRLSVREWVFVIGVTAVTCVAAPWLSGDRPEGDLVAYRVPDELNEDYWWFERVAERAKQDADAVIFGDSVVWGAYVRNDETLSARLSTDDRRIANLGLQGAHPLAVEGLIEHHASAIRGMGVILHFNPLWISSERHDLSQKREFQFNHPELVPQITMDIPCYRATWSERIGISVRRHVGVLKWGRHLQHAGFGSLDIPSWTVENPDANPLDALRAAIPGPTSSPVEKPITWRERGIRAQSFSWVDLGTSRQWAAFKRTVTLLRERGNRVVVLVGPFNHHLLTPKSLTAYRDRFEAIVTWLKDNDVPYDRLTVELMDAQFADASHPLADGYRSQAEGIRQSGILERLE